MSTPASSPSSGVRRRVISSPRNTQDLKLRLATADTSSNGNYMMGFVSPLSELVSGSPSQLQPLTPELNGRPSAGHGPGWPASSNLLSDSNKNSNASNSKSKAPPALDIVSPTAASRHSVNRGERDSLLDLDTRKDIPSNSVDVSAERCALSPSSALGGRSSTFTPTFDTSNANSSVTPPRASSTPFGDATMTPPPNAPRSYSRRTGGPRDSVPPPPPPPPPPSATGFGLRSATLRTAVESPTHLPAEARSPLRLLQPRHNIELKGLARIGDVSGENDVPYTWASSSDDRARHSDGSRPSAASLSVPKIPALVPSSRHPQTGSILATSSQNNPANSSPTLTPTATCSKGDQGNGSGTNTTRTPTCRSREVRGKASRAPRLASHLFLEQPTPDSLVPTKSDAPSPALTEPRQRDSRNGSGGGRMRTSRGSSEGRVSVSTDNSNVALSPLCGTSRPNALNFARGELIGKGSFGAVYRGMQRNTNQIICMKEIRLPGIVEELQRQQQQAAMVAEDATSHGPAPASTSTSTSTSITIPPPPTPQAAGTPDTKESAALLRQLQGVKRELALLKQLNHPNIVKYLNDEIVDGQLRIYMEYVSGGSVASAVKTYGSFAEPQAAALCCQLLQGLSYLHGHGIVHRDLKGDNLLLETSSVLKIADFGTAKSVMASATMTTNIVGTAYFMAPEMLRLDGLVGTAADIWSTGCCLIEMLTGKPPLSDIPNQYSVMMAIAGSPKVPLEKYIPADNTWSSEVHDFLKQCLRLNPASRPKAQELLQHPWIIKYCDREMLLLHSATTSTSTTTTTSVAHGGEQVRNSNASGNVGGAVGAFAVPSSPDAVVTATPKLAAAAAAAAISPLPRSLCGSGETEGPSRNATPRERRSKKDRQGGASRRQHSRDAPSQSCNGAGAGREEAVVPKDAFPTPSPPPTGGNRLSDETPASIPLNGPLGHNPVTGSPLPCPQTSTDFPGRTRYTGGPSNPSAPEDDRKQSFNYDYPLSSPARLAGVTAQSSGTFLPAILAPGGSAAPSVCGTHSIEVQRGSRLARALNLGSLRDDTRAYYNPSDGDLVRRDSARLAKDFSFGAHEYGRDFTDGCVRYGSAARIPLPESGLEPGLYSTLDCLTAPPTVEEAPPSASSRRSTSRRVGRGG
ncbi:putative protein kinase [Leptomonas pyrrhocoris]|uniref:Protein kinase domain-containing protein n=1 Tax=Leptomonas pyrrhocoris TaxID=157538 RepID=A0A0M9FW81_LEPPY|nr:putative protein kinase [Leptomonas pyrrhocoris]KPA77345.1 putative protein kinase [Leptomonas pyrrhocoris]|eukprot:XP_015655784.1 putative protein kinase [Leptomonas pyrrhocoris]